jgi:hypothetical protein
MLLTYQIIIGDDGRVRLLPSLKEGLAPRLGRSLTRPIFNTGDKFSRLLINNNN